jgi:hypothetical protein
MNSLSRREEETLLKTTKAYALKQCDSLLQGALEFTLFSPDNSFIITQNLLRVQPDGQSLLLGLVEISSALFKTA